MESVESTSSSCTAASGRGEERRGEGKEGATGGRSNGEAAFDRLGAPSAGHERPRARRTKGDAEFY